jgi:rubrerythrin
MSLLLTFMDLDKLYESKQWLDRQTLVSKIKNSGRWNYRFNKYSDEQLYRMWERIQKEMDKELDMLEYSNGCCAQHDTCEECGTLLNDGGTCPICDDGEEDYLVLA